MLLTKKEILSFGIGLDSQDEEYIEEDGLDWFPIFVQIYQTHKYTSQFFGKDEAEMDTFCKFRYKANNATKARYISVKDLSTLEMGMRLSDSLLAENVKTGITWMPMFIKSPKGLIYNPFLPKIDFKIQKFRITLEGV